MRGVRSEQLALFVVHGLSTFYVFFNLYFLTFITGCCNKSYNLNTLLCCLFIVVLRNLFKYRAVTYSRMACKPIIWVCSFVSAIAMGYFNSSHGPHTGALRVHAGAPVRMMESVRTARRRLKSTRLCHTRERAKPDRTTLCVCVVV